MKRSILLLAVTIGLISPGVVSASPIIDPTGDTFYTGTIDITSTEVILGSPTITINMTFAAAIAPPSAFAANSVVGFIDLDTAPGPGGTVPWGGPVVGGNNWINFFIPPNSGTPSVPGPLVGLGDEFFIDLGSELFNPGFVNVVSTTTGLAVGVAPISYLGSSLQILLPAALIGNPTSLSYGALVGDFLSPTDRAPNGAEGITVSAAIPEPTTLTVFAVLTVGALGMRRRVKADAAV